MVYRESLMGREILWSKWAEALQKQGRIDIFIRGHWHQSIVLITAGVTYIQIPSWCCFIPWHGSLLLYSRAQPDIGGMLLYIDEDDRVSVKDIQYPLPHVVDETTEM
jgi:hypothetical protein